MTRIRRNTSARHQRNARRAEQQVRAAAYKNVATIYTVYNILDFIIL